MSARHPLASDAAHTRLRGAIAAIEARSAAEIVLAMRPAADRWVDVDLKVGAAAAWLALVFTLFADLEFDLDTIALVVPVTGIAAGLVARLVPPLRLALAGERRIEAAVQRAARAEFVEARVSYTRARTGVLVYVALFERRVAVIVDAGIERAIESVRAEWDAAVRRLAQTVEGTRLRDSDAFADALAGLGPVLERVVPRSSDDMDELPDFADAPARSE